MSVMVYRRQTVSCDLSCALPELPLHLNVSYGHARAIKCNQRLSRGLQEEARPRRLMNGGRCRDWGRSQRPFRWDAPSSGVAQGVSPRRPFLSVTNSGGSISNRSSICLGAVWSSFREACDLEPSSHKVVAFYLSRLPERSTVVSCKLAAQNG